jgi:hypothetical protein
LLENKDFITNSIIDHFYKLLMLQLNIHVIVGQRDLAIGWLFIQIRILLCLMNLAPKDFFFKDVTKKIGNVFMFIVLTNCWLCIHSLTTNYLVPNLTYCVCFLNLCYWIKIWCCFACLIVCNLLFMVLTHWNIMVITN